MGLFDKLKQVFGTKDEAAAIAQAEARIDAFWRTWGALEPALVEQVGGRMDDGLVASVSDAVRSLHANLEWEFGPGVKTPHAFTVTGAGDARLRLLAERWRRAAPTSATFEFYPVRQPSGREQLDEAGIQLGDTRVDFGQIRFALETDETRRSIDTTLVHPVFDTLDERGQRTLAFVLLDQALGEDGVERWIGGIDWTATTDAETTDLAGLHAAVEAMAAIPEDTWCIGNAEEDGLPLVFVVNLALKRWDYPLFDTFCGVDLPYEAGDGGMPEPAEKAALDELEDGLLALLGDDAVHLGRRTGAGLRRTYLYVDGSGDAAARILAWSRDCGRTARVEVDADPAWEHRP